MEFDYFTEESASAGQKAQHYLLSKSENIVIQATKRDSACGRSYGLGAILTRCWQGMHCPDSRTTEKWMSMKRR